jgi:hypothetical protein
VVVEVDRRHFLAVPIVGVPPMADSHPTESMFAWLVAGADLL